MQDPKGIALKWCSIALARTQCSRPSQHNRTRTSSQKPSIIKGAESHSTFVESSVKLCLLRLTQFHLKYGPAISAMLSKQYMRPVLVPPTSLLNSSTDSTHKFLDPLLGFKEDAVSLKQPQQALPAATQNCLAVMLPPTRGHTPETVPARHSFAGRRNKMTQQ